MATNQKNNVIVELYDLSITERQDDRFGRVIKTKSLTEDDLINIAISRRTDLNASTLKAAIDILKEIAKEEICNGASVSFGLGYFSLGVNGVFFGDNARWENDKHHLTVQISPNTQLRQSVQATTVNVRGMAASGTVINSVQDVASGEENSRLTPGGGVNVSGTKIRIEGNSPEVGIALVIQETSNEIKISTTSILTNDPSKLIFIVPADLAKGDYKLILTTQFSTSGALLKEPRSYEFEYMLNVE